MDRVAEHSVVPALGAVLRRCQAQVQADSTGTASSNVGFVSRRRVRVARAEFTFGAGRGSPVPTHVATQRLADRELEPAYGAAVQPRPRRRRRGALALARLIQQPNPAWPRVAAVGVGLGAPVAGAVPAQRLERREPPAARLALEHAPAPADAEPRRRRPRAALLLLLPPRELHQDAGRVHSHAGRPDAGLLHGLLCA